MKFEFDQAKSDKNEKERGLPFRMAAEFDFETAIFQKDGRRDYGEVRINALGYIADRLHVLCFKPIARRHIRVISLRKANGRERAFYEEKTA